VIGLPKLASLPPRTRRRKLALLLQQAELSLERGQQMQQPQLEYWRGLALLLAGDEKAGPEVRAQAQALASAAGPQASLPELRRALNRARHALLAFLGAEPAEWDLLSAGGALDPGARRTLPLAVYLEELRSPFNVGAIFRTAEAFGLERVLLSPGTASPLHPRASRSARGATGVLPWEVAPLETLAGRGGIVALELRGTPLGEFPFPPRGVLLVGSEELGLSPQALAVADAGRVSIPMAGAKRSLNVAVACGIVLQAWAARLQAPRTDRPAAD
jgi:TrmH family RNA methyltransferase